MLDPDFGHWFAGFVDGEGCFSINRNGVQQPGGERGYNCTFSIGLRQDDVQTLHEIQRRLGLGSTVEELMGRTLGNPAAIFRIGRKAECATLVEILDRFPLRARKVRDYVVWREAVIEWQAIKGGRHVARDWGRMATLRQRLKDAKAYA